MIIIDSFYLFFYFQNLHLNFFSIQYLLKTCFKVMVNVLILQFIVSVYGRHFLHYHYTVLPMYTLS